MILFEEKYKLLTPELKSEANDFIDFLLNKRKKSANSKKRPFGLCKNEIVIHKNFDDPLTDEELKE